MSGFKLINFAKPLVRLHTAQPSIKTISWKPKLAGVKEVTNINLECVIKKPVTNGRASSNWSHIWSPTQPSTGTKSSVATLMNGMSNTGSYHLFFPTINVNDAIKQIDQSIINLDLGNKCVVDPGIAADRIEQHLAYQYSTLKDLYRVTDNNKLTLIGEIAEKAGLERSENHKDYFVPNMAGSSSTVTELTKELLGKIPAKNTDPLNNQKCIAYLNEKIDKLFFDVIAKVRKEYKLPSDLPPQSPELQRLNKLVGATAETFKQDLIAVLQDKADGHSNRTQN